MRDRLEANPAPPLKFHNPRLRLGRLIDWLKLGRGCRSAGVLHDQLVANPAQPINLYPRLKLGRLIDWLTLGRGCWFELDRLGMGRTRSVEANPAQPLRFHNPRLRLGRLSDWLKLGRGCWFELDRIGMSHPRSARGQSSEAHNLPNPWLRLGRLILAQTWPRMLVRIRPHRVAGCARSARGRSSTALTVS